jgi:hypothetical protein
MIKFINNLIVDFRIIKWKMSRKMRNKEKNFKNETKEQEGRFQKKIARIDELISIISESDFSEEDKEIIKDALLNKQIEMKQADVLEHMWD